jgi:hypothetical protein
MGNIKKRYTDQRYNRMKFAVYSEVPPINISLHVAFDRGSLLRLLTPFLKVWGHVSAVLP